MYNKKVLSTAVKNLNKAKAPKQPKDIITDPEGQWKFPGQITRIPGNDITMAGVNYPVLGVSDTGQEMMMYPGINYTFPGANYVDEYPQMKKGGFVKLPNKSKKGSKSKAYSRSLEATNKLFAENPLFKKSKSRKSKIYDPNAKYYQDGGEYLELDLTPEEIEEYAKGGYIIEDISVPELTKAQKGKIVTPLYIENPLEYKFRKNMYDDSLRLYNAYKMQDKLMGPGSYKTKDKYKWNTAELKEGRRKRIVKGLESYGPMAQDFQSEADQFKDGYNNWTARKQDKQLLDYYKKLGFKPNQIMYHSSPDVVSDKIKAIGSYFDGDAVSPIYKKPVQPVTHVKPETTPEIKTTTGPDPNRTVIGETKITKFDENGNIVTTIEYIYEDEQPKVQQPVTPEPQPEVSKDKYAYRTQWVREADGTLKPRQVPYAIQKDGKGRYELLPNRQPGYTERQQVSFQRGGIKKYQIAGEVTTPVETAPAETDEVVPVYTNPVYSDVMKWLNENPIYVAPDKPLSINEYEQINTQDMYPKMSGKLLYIPKAGYFNEQQYKVVKEFPVEGGDPIRIYEVVGGEGRKKYIVDDRGFNKEFFSLYQEPKGRTREIYPVYGRGLPYRKYGGILSKMQDGGNFYTLKGSKGVYRKVGNKWEVDWNRTGNFQPLSKGDVKERTANLNKNAQPLYDRDYTAMMGVKSEAPVPQNPFTTNFVNQFGITDQAIANASAVAPTVENAQKLERLTQQKAYEDALRQRQAAARQRENELLEQSKFTNVPLSQVSDETQMYTDDVERQAIAGAPAAREARKRQAEFEKQQWEKYNKMSTFERIMDRTKGFMVDPLGMTSRALMGEQGYIPGMGEGLLNKDDPDYYKYLVAAGYTPGEFDMFDVQSMVNPMYWGASIGNNINKGNYLDAGIEAVLTFAPMVPKGTISQGARMLGDDVSRGVNYLTTKTPVKNTYKLNPNALKENPEVLLHRVQKPGQTEEYITKHYGKEMQPGWGRAFSSDPSDMLYYTNSSVRKQRGYLDDPEILRLRVPKKDIDQFNIYNFNEFQKSQGLRPYAFGSNKPTQEFVLPIQEIIKAEKFNLNDLDQLMKEADRFNTPHWWRGYGSKTPKQLPGSPNVPNTIQLNDVGNVNMASGFSNAIPAQKITNPLSRTYRIVDDKIRSAIENFKSIYKEPSIEDIEKKIIRKRNIKNVTQQDAEKVFNEQMQERLNFYNTAEGKERIERFLKDNQLQGLVTPDEFIERMSNVKYFNANEQQLVQKQYNQLMNNYYELQGQIKNRLNKKNEIELLLDNTLENDSDKWWDLATELENIDKELENIYKVSDQTLEQVNNLPNVSKDVAYYSPSKNKVFIGNDYIKEPSTLKVTGIHEGGHAANFEPYLAIQEKYPTAQINWENLGADIKINQDLKNPALFDFEDIRDLPEHLKSFDNKSLLKSASSVSPLAQERYKNPLKYIQNEYEYFMSKDEASSFLAELIPLLQERGHIKNFGDHIEPQMVADIFDYYRKNSSKLTMEPYRILDIMKPTAKTIQNLANKLNDLHVIAPVIGTTAGAVLYNQSNNQNKEPQQFDKGGIVSELSKKEINDLVAQGYIIEDAD